MFFKTTTYPFLACSSAWPHWLQTQTGLGAAAQHYMTVDPPQPGIHQCTSADKAGTQMDEMTWLFRMPCMSDTLDKLIWSGQYDAM